MALRPSLLRHLVAWTVGALLVVWVAFVAVGFQTGIQEADELTDGHLASVAFLMLRQPVSEFGPAPSTAALAGRAGLKAHDYQQSLSIAAWDSGGRLLARIGEAPMPAFTSAEGFETLSLGDHETRWRAFSRWAQPAHDTKIMVLLSLAERDALADDIAIHVAAPGIWLLPVIALVLTLAVHQGLRPLTALSKEIRSLDINRDACLHAPAHEEFQSIAESITHLIGRYNAALERERALASEVAHELRTPLSAMTLHAASLRHASSAAEREEALRQLEQGAARAGHVLTHLLSLARASRAELAEAAQTIDLVELARRVSGEYGQAAFSSGHEISLAPSSPCPVKAHPALLEIALRNLIDNALMHTPSGTAVQISVSPLPPTIAVCDTGRARRNQGFAPAPARNSGLSLGHQVVRRVAAVHGGRLDVADQLDEGTTCYRIVLGESAAVA